MKCGKKACVHVLLHVAPGKDILAVAHDPDRRLGAELDLSVLLVEDKQALLHIVQQVKVVNFKHFELLLGARTIHHCHRDGSEDEQSNEDE